MSTPESGYVTLSQVAVRTGRHPELLRQWCAGGRLPCVRVGGSWVMVERDVSLIDGIASRSRRQHAPVASVNPSPDRVLAAVFDDETAAQLAGEALHDRLAGAAQDVGLAPLVVPALPALSLTVVGARVAGTSVIRARRVLTAFGGRIVADIEEIRAAPDEAGSGDGLAPTVDRAEDERRVQAAETE